MNRIRRTGPAGKALRLTSVYFSQGLPFGFFTQALPTLLKQGGYSLTTIGAVASVLALFPRTSVVPSQEVPWFQA